MRRPGLRSGMVLLVWGSAGLSALGAGAPVKIPVLRGTSFAGTAVRLPEDLQGKVGVLVMGFSQGSKEETTAWGTRLARAYEGDTGVMYYELPMLAGVPRLLRGVVTGAIKNSVAEAGRKHFVVVLEGESEWRRVARYKEADDAYVVVVDGSGDVLWTTHGAATDAAWAGLEGEVRAVRGRP